MDNLVLGHAAYAATVKFSREGRPEELLRHVEKLSFDIEQLFTHCREAVRTSNAYRAAGFQTREAIERAVFGLARKDSN